MEYPIASRVLFAAAGLYAAPSPTITLGTGGANATVASTAHGLSTGNTVIVSGTTGVTGLNASFEVKVTGANSFELLGTGALTGTVAGTAAIGLPDLDISGTSFSKEWYLRVKIYGTGLVSFEDTVNNWTATQTRFLANSRSADEGQEFIFSWRDWEGGDRFGVTSAKLRIRLISGTNVTVSAALSTNG